MGKKLFELFSIKNDFTKYFAKCWNLFTHFVLPIVAILLIHFYTTGQSIFQCVA